MLLPISHQAVKTTSVSRILPPRRCVRTWQCYDESYRSVNHPVIDYLCANVTIGGATVRPALKVMRDVFKGGDLAWARKGQALKGTTANRKSHPEPDFLSIIRTPKPPNLGHANKITVVSKNLLKKEKIKVVLSDAAYSSRIPTDHRALFSPWPRANNDVVIFSSDEVQSLANMTNNQIIRACLRTDESKMRVCMTYDFLGVLSVAMTADAKSAPPMVADLVPGHNQTKEFDKNLGSTLINEWMELAKPLISESLRNRQAIFIDGDAGKKALPDVIQEENQIVEYLSNEMIGRCFLFFENLQQKVGRDDHLAMLVRNVEKKHMCLVFTCMQLASTIGGPQSVHWSGNFADNFFHEWICDFLVIAKAPRHHNFLPNMKFKDLLLYILLFKEGATKITAMLHQDGLMHKTEVYLMRLGVTIGGACGLGKVNRRIGVDHV